MTVKRSLAVIATLISISNVYAADVPASFDAKNCKADYPKAALMNEEQGTVAMKFLVSADGKVIESKLEKTSGYKSLDKAALQAIAACKFHPGTKDGKPGETWTTVEYAWKI
ncbi:MAG: energy transducer TonB [Pseudomonadota bacterium]